MTDVHPINQTLLTILDNQRDRREAALENIETDVFHYDPPADCNSICAIGRHLVMLRAFSLKLLESDLACQVPDHNTIENLDDLNDALDQSHALMKTAITLHDPADWYQTPETEREGPWGDEPTIIRVTRPLNDFVNHLGSIRTIRRIRENPNDRTQ